MPRAVSDRGSRLPSSVARLPASLHCRSERGCRLLIGDTDSDAAWLPQPRPTDAPPVRGTHGIPGPWGIPGAFLCARAAFAPPGMPWGDVTVACMGLACLSGPTSLDEERAQIACANGIGESQGSFPPGTAVSPGECPPGGEKERDREGGQGHTDNGHDGHRCASLTLQNDSGTHHSTKLPHALQDRPRNTGHVGSKLGHHSRNLGHAGRNLSHEAQPCGTTCMLRTA